MLTPLDIHNKDFKKGMLGYSQDDVDAFLDKVEKDFEKLYKENAEFKERINILQEKVNYYKSMEDTIQNALVVAQTTAQDVTSSAHKKAEVIISEAEHKAEIIINKAKSEVEKIRLEFENSRKQMQIFKTRFKTLLESQLEVVMAEVAIEQE